MRKILDLSAQKYALYIKHSGHPLLNKALIDLLGSDFTEEGSIKSLVCKGKRIKAVLLTDKEMKAFIEYQSAEPIRFDACIGRPGEREVFDAVIGIRCGEVSFKEKLQEAIDARLVAFKLASHPPRRRIAVRRRPIQLFPAHPRPLREQTV